MSGILHFSAICCLSAGVSYNGPKILISSCRFHALLFSKWLILPIHSCWEFGLNLFTTLRLQFKTWTDEVFLLVKYARDFNINVSIFFRVDRAEPSSHGSSSWEGTDHCTGRQEFWDLIPSEKWFNHYSLSHYLYLLKYLGCFLRPLPRLKLHSFIQQRQVFIPCLFTKHCQDSGYPALKKVDKKASTFQKLMWFSRTWYAI